MKEYLSVDEFRNSINKGIALFGAGLGGKRCYEYLEKIGLSAQVKMFIDNNIDKQGQYLFDKPINNIETLAKYPEMIVVSATALYKQVINCFREKGLSNKLYGWLDFNAMFPDDPLVADRDFIASFYEQDEMTGNIIDMMLQCRTDNNISRIQPMELVEHLNMVTNYWFDDVSLHNEDMLTIFDCGSFIGDCFEFWFENYSDKIKSIHAFEPDQETYHTLKENVLTYQKGNVIKCHNSCLGSENRTAYFAQGQDYNSCVSDSDSGYEVKMICVDDLGEEIEGKLCIKMDIEGYEIPALQGAEKIIRKYKPNLAICVYHKDNDIFRIPQYIKSLVPEYKCKLRGGSHMVCYASV